MFVVDETDAGTVEEALDTWGALETSPFPYPAGGIRVTLRVTLRVRRSQLSQDQRNNSVGARSLACTPRCVGPHLRHTRRARTH